MRGARWNLRASFFLLILGAMLTAAGAQVPAVPTIPQSLSPEIQRYLAARRDQFTARRVVFVTQASSHNERCHDVALKTAAAEECAAARRRLTQDLADLQMAADALAVEIGAAGGRKALDIQRQIARMVAQLPKVGEIEKSPGAGEAHKALEAAAKHDWPVALAWWQTALQKDPANESLKRSVDLAQWMVHRPTESTKLAAPKWSAAQDKLLNDVIDQASRGNAPRALSQIKALQAENQSLFEEANRLTAGILMEETLRSEDHRASAAHPEQVSAPISTREPRALSDEMYEQALMIQLIGDQKEAEEMFKQADFFYMFDQGKPFRIDTNKKLSGDPI